MKFGTFETRHRTMIIAEVGNNHEGSFAAAEELVGRAAESGVDAVKFQTFKTEQFVSPLQPERVARMKKFELSYEQFGKLAVQARKANIGFVSTPLDLESARFLGGIVDVMKIASGDNDFPEIIREAASSGKPLIISTGLAEPSDIAYAKAYARRVWQERKHHGALALLHCVSSYPVDASEANLGAIREMQALYGDSDTLVGYSDHVLGIRASVLAVAVGARIIEKHFTLDRNYSDFRDHQLSADPAMLKQMVQEIREVEQLVGAGVKVPQPAELAARESIRRSIAAARDLAPGEVVTLDALVWLRPGTGIRPGHESQVLGRKTKRTVKAGSLLSPDDFE